MFIHITYFIFYYCLFISCAVTYKELFLYARTSRMVFGTRWEATRWMWTGEGPSSPPHRDSEGPSSPLQHIDSDGNPLSPLLWPDDGTVPPWRRRADGTEIPESPRMTYAAASAALPPGFLDPLPPHLRGTWTRTWTLPQPLHPRDPYHEPQPEPESEPEEDPEEEPEEEPAEEHDDGAASGTDSEPDEGL